MSEGQPPSRFLARTQLNITSNFAKFFAQQKIWVSEAVYLAERNRKVACYAKARLPNQLNQCAVVSVANQGMSAVVRQAH